MAWAVVDGQSRVERVGMAGDGGMPAGQPARTILVLPGADAQLKRLELPARSEAQARAGAEMLFGGKLAGGEKMHYAIGAPQDAAGARLVAAIAEPRLQAWLDQCWSVGADPHIVVLDCTVWPVDDEVAIVVTPNRVIVAGGQLGGFSTDPAIAPTLTARWLNDADADGSRMVVWGGDAESYRRTLQRDFEVRDAADAVACLAAGAANIAAFAPNLRQGAFVAEGRKQQPFKFWRLTALLAVAAVMLQVGSLVISGVRDRQTASQIEAAAERDFRAARPDVGRVVNLRAQVAALVNAQTQAARHPVLVTSNPVADALRQQPLAPLDEVRHQAPAREVRLTITAQDQPSIDAIAALLREADLTVETRIVRPRDGRVAAELVVGAP
jgi:type II secretion system protein L